MNAMEIMIFTHGNALCNVIAYSVFVLKMSAKSERGDRQTRRMVGYPHVSNSFSHAFLAISW